MGARVVGDHHDLVNQGPTEAVQGAGLNNLTHYPFYPGLSTQKYRDVTARLLHSRTTKRQKSQVMGHAAVFLEVQS